MKPLNVGLTGLALLAFLGDGNTTRQGPYQDAVRRGVSWIQESQRTTGMFGSAIAHEYMYCHAIATLALCEACGLSGDESLRESTQRGLDLIARARNPGMVWRYDYRSGQNDSSITAWMLMALKAGEDFGFEVDRAAFADAKRWFDAVTDDAGCCGYTKVGEASARTESMFKKFPAQKTEALTALGLLCRFVLGQDPKKTPVMGAAQGLIMKKLPTWDTKAGCIDMYFWFYASHALFQMGGPGWTSWSKRLTDAALQGQVQAGHSKGSWDPADAWGEEGGRVYSTAMMTLSLEATYRLGKLEAR